MRPIPTKSRILTYCITLLFLWPAASYAKLLQILHTNDLHAYYDSAENPEKGGYAALKSVMDSLREQAARDGVETIVLDGGDFSDGTMYRYADQGASPYVVLDAMGYDAVAIGNHDWLIGAKEMDRILGRVRPSTPYLGANFAIDRKTKNLAKHIRPYISLERAGSKIAILGVTTDEFIYSWRVEKGSIQPSLETAELYAEMLKEDHDFVFVLSHQGTKKDKEMGKTNQNVDLIIGAHSHDLLGAPAYLSSRKVPYVQAGAHGEYVGRLVIDIEPGKPLKVVHYELVEVRSDGPKDPVIASMVEQARLQLLAQYEGNWLEEVIAFSEVPMSLPGDGATPWGNIFAEAIRETARAPASLDMSEFYGTPHPAGPITREALYNYYPRTFSTEKPFGWTVWRIRAQGWLIKMVIEQAARMGSNVNTAGITYKVKTKRGKPDYYAWRINGKPLYDAKIYTIGVSEGLGRGTSEISRLLRLFFKPRDTGVPIWHAVESRLQRMGPILAPQQPKLH